MAPSSVTLVTKAHIHIIQDDLDHESDKQGATLECEAANEENRDKNEEKDKDLLDGFKANGQSVDEELKVPQLHILPQAHDRILAVLHGNLLWRRNDGWLHFGETEMCGEVEDRIEVKSLIEATRHHTTV